MSASPRIESFLDQISAISDKVNAQERLVPWMLKHLKLGGRKYRLTDHEFQTDILNDPHPRIAIPKCSQIGMTEASLRLAAALAAVNRYRIIYVFPSATFSQKVSTDRFLPILTQSPILNAMQRPEARGSAMRKVGNSTIYFVGASGTTQAISIPADVLIIDEQNFCDPTVLGQFRARLRHSHEDAKTGHRGKIYEFSTPTLPNYGVDKSYARTDQRVYMVKCGHCGTWQYPSFHNDYVIPGYEKPMSEFSAHDLVVYPTGVEKAYVKCRKASCGKDLWKSLCNPKLRAWVAKHPEVTSYRGYKVAPIDVPAYNKIPQILGQIAGYTKQDYYNFVLGLSYASADNSFLQDIFESSDRSTFIPLSQASSLLAHDANTVAGLDVGKRSWLTILKREKVTGKGRLHLIHATPLDAKAGNSLSEQVSKYMEAFGVKTIVVDAAPDFSTAFGLIDKHPEYNRVFGCEYVQKISEAYSNIMPKPELGVVKAYRTGTLTDLMEAHNAGAIAYPQHDEVNIIAEHMENVKKVKKSTDFAGDTYTFQKSGPDHYVHSLNYAMMADTIANERIYLAKKVGVLPSIRAVTMKGSE